MLSKAHLTSHCRMSVSKWVITPSWLSGSWTSFLYSSVYFFHLFLISSASVSVLYRAHLCMKCSLGISNFLDEISSLSHPIVFLYLFALITEEGFLISPCYVLELCIQMGISLAVKNIINLISVLTIWWCPCVESSLVLLEEGVCYDQWVLLAKLC